MNLTGLPIFQALSSRKSSTQPSPTLHGSTRTFPSRSTNLPSIMFTNIVPSFHIAPLTPKTSNNSKRTLQNVLTEHQRQLIVKWMLETVENSNTNKHIASRSVKNFPMCFRGSKKANNIRAVRLWKNQSKHVTHGSSSSKEISKSITSLTKTGVRRTFLKPYQTEGEK